MADLVGTYLGKYRIVEHLGRGGMAEVYKGYQPGLDRYVAIKVMHTFLAEDPDFLSRFEREAKNVAALRHPNIVQVHDFDTQDGNYYMVMEYIEGVTLKRHLINTQAGGERLPLAEAIRIIRDVGNALAYAHQRDMIHRDVKPANVMMDKNGHVILTDFGIARIITGPKHTATGATVGTPAYMAPELGLGKRGDWRADIYSLGVMLYQITVGRLPFDADTPLAVMLQHVNDPLPMPRSINPDLPGGLERIILKAMAKDPDDRFQNVAEMVAALGDLEKAGALTVPSQAGPRAARQTQYAPTGTTRDGGQPAAVAPPRRSGLWMVVAGIFGALVLSGAAIVAFLMTDGFGLLGGPASATQTPAPTSANSPEPAASATAAPTDRPLTPTPDAQASALAALQLTVQAVAATATPTPTPDLTATALACKLDYALTDQRPEDNRILAVNAAFEVDLELTNTGECVYPDGVTLAETGLEDPQAFEPVPVGPLAQGQNVELQIHWQGPAQPGEQVRTFEVQTAAGDRIGEELRLTYRFIIPVTATPRPAPTFTPPAETPTPEVGKVSDFFPLYQSCSYAAGDYQCVVNLVINGGQPPFTIFIDGSQRFFFKPDEPVLFPLIGRRCSPRPYTVQVLDDFGSNFTRSFQFNPDQNGSVFPGGGCTLP